MPPKKMMQGWRVYATLMLYVVPLFESPMMMMLMYDVCVRQIGLDKPQQASRQKQKQASGI